MSDIKNPDLNPAQKATIAERQAAHRLLQAVELPPEDERHRAVVDEAQAWATLAASHRTAALAETLIEERKILSETIYNASGRV